MGGRFQERDPDAAIPPSLIVSDPRVIDHYQPYLKNGGSKFFFWGVGELRYRSCLIYVNTHTRSNTFLPSPPPHTHIYMPPTHRPKNASLQKKLRWWHIEERKEKKKKSKKKNILARQPPPGYMARNKTYFTPDRLPLLSGGGRSVREAGSVSNYWCYLIVA